MAIAGRTITLSPILARFSIDKNDGNSSCDISGVNRRTNKCSQIDCPKRAMQFNRQTQQMPFMILAAYFDDDDDYDDDDEKA